MNHDEPRRDPSVAPDEVLKKVDEALRALPTHPVPEATVRRTLARVAQARERQPANPWGWGLLAAASALTVVGAWVVTTRSAVSGDQAGSAVDAVARLDPKSGGARGRYTLRRTEIKATVKEKAKEINGEQVASDRGEVTTPASPAPADDGGGVVDGRFGSFGGGDQGARAGDFQLGQLLDGFDGVDGLDNTLADLPALPAGAASISMTGDTWATVSADGKLARPADANVVAGGEVAGQSGPAFHAERGPANAEARGGLAGDDGGAGRDKDDDGREAAADASRIAAGAYTVTLVPAAAEATVVRWQSVGDDVTGKVEKAAEALAGWEARDEDRDGLLDVEDAKSGDGDGTKNGLKDELSSRRVPAQETGEGHRILDPTDSTTTASTATDSTTTASTTTDAPPATTKGEEERPAKQDAARATDDAERGGVADGFFWRLEGENARVTLGGKDASAPATPALTLGLREQEVTRNAPYKKAATGLAQATVPIVTPRELVPASTAVAGLAFLPARGYFRNTYLPGDTERAWLRASLADRLQRDGVELALEQRAQAPTQPFAAPAGRGLGLSVTADRVAAAGPTRMTVQIGLAGAQRVATRRAPLGLALVLDVAAVSGEAERQALWGLADAVVAGRQPGDRVSVIVTGAADGAPVVLRGEGLSGPELRRALAGAFEARVPARAEDLERALASAVSEAQAGASAEAPIGAELVVVASSRAPEAAVAARLEGQAHRAALAGVHVTTVAVGASGSGDALAAVAAAGQGRRLLARNAEMARDAMAGELAASGRAVARAVRLRVRLGAGVKLVAVLGSAPLDEPAADRVRAAEVAIDKQVRATTGIEADRGADEDGLQIVIPAFYAGDRHVILLDVVASGAGPLVDVRARFKDLVALDNGDAAVSLTLGDAGGEAAPTPAARNVLANRAAFALGGALLEVADALGRGDGASAWRVLAEARAGIDALVAREPALERAVDADRALLDDYVALLGDVEAWVGDPEITAWVSRSLRLAARVQGVGP